MSWIQENKFVAGLIGVTAVLGGAIFYFGNSQGGAYDEKMEEYEGLKSQYLSLEKATPYPNEENLKAREQGVSQYHRTINAVRTGLAAYRPDALAPMSAEGFNDARVKMMNNLSAVFKEAGVDLPEETSFGFEKYASSSAKSAATPKLNYQLGATEWLLTKLAEVKPDSIANIHRVPLAVEDGKPVAEAEPARGRKGRAARRAAAKAKPVEAKPYDLMPMALTFTADESSVRAFLKEMVNSKEYYYAVRAVRIRNSKQTAPTEKDANFPAPVAPPAGAAPDPFGGAFPEFDGASGGDGEAATPDAAEAAAPEPAAAPAVVAGEQILKQVLGSEKLDVHIVFDVVLFKPKAAAAEEAASADSE